MNYGPKYLPGKFLKTRWTRWSPGVGYGQVARGPQGHQADDTAYRGAGPVSEMGTIGNGIRRDTSIRSIITLPAYSFSPKPTEQIIAREGEREGMDIVVEYPETAEEEEMRREAHMENLYRLRLQRRRQIEEREARRLERRQARARGSQAHQGELQQNGQAQDRSSRLIGGTISHQSGSNILADQLPHEQERRISSVSYAELGYVRHDGSRVRSSSPGSDRHPLLATNLSTSQLSLANGAQSAHSRGGSFASSILSVSTTGSDIDTSRSQAPVTLDEGDLGCQRILPPDYEHLQWGEAPAYESSAAANAENLPVLPNLAPLPTIHIEVASPTNSNRPVRSIQPHQAEETNVAHNT